MKTALAALVALAATLKVGTGIGDRAAPFQATLVYVEGDKTRTRPYDSSKQRRATAYVFVGARCPTTARYVDRFLKLEAAYAKKGIDFVYVYPNKTDSSDEKLAFHRARGFAGPMIDDRGGRIARLLGAMHTSEILLVDRKGKILYRGAADDAKDPAQVKRHHLAAALDEHLAGKPVTMTQTPVFA